ncbi:unnamed protein product, partial [Musa acuminata subsp. burmannicoides]
HQFHIQQEDDLKMAPHRPPSSSSSSEEESRTMMLIEQRLRESTSSRLSWS